MVSSLDLKLVSFGLATRGVDVRAQKRALDAAESISNLGGGLGIHIVGSGTLLRDRQIPNEIRHVILALRQRGFAIAFHDNDWPADEDLPKPVVTAYPDDTGNLLFDACCIEYTKLQIGTQIVHVTSKERNYGFEAAVDTINRLPPFFGKHCIIIRNSDIANPDVDSCVAGLDSLFITNADAHYGAGGLLAMMAYKIGILNKPVLAAMNNLVRLGRSHLSSTLNGKHLVTEPDFAETQHGFDAIKKIFESYNFDFTNQELAEVLSRHYRVE